MGSEQSGPSQADYERYATELYEASLQRQCILPDIGIDQALLHYSGSNSNAVLQAYSQDQMSLMAVDKVQGYVAKVESFFSPMTSIPHAVGLGAFFIYMVLELSKKKTESGAETHDTYSMFQRVFAEEKASSVRDTMSKWMTRHQMNLNNDRQLLEEIQRLEKQLSSHLTALRDSLLLAGQMSSRGLKIWVNGAAFHIQMLIFEAQLSSGSRRSNYVDKITAVINLFLLDLEHLLELYKTHETRTYSITFQSNYIEDGWLPRTCMIESNDDKKCRNLVVVVPDQGPCGYNELTEAYMTVVFSKYSPVSGLKTYFSNIQSNLTSLINQQGSFTLPSAG